MNGRRIFNRGSAAQLARLHGYSSTAGIRRIALSGGVGLDCRRMEIYDYMMANRWAVFTEEFAAEFAKRDRRCDA